MAEPWKPMANHDTQRYWAGCEARELLIARCDDCGFWIHPPKGVCSKCWSGNIGRHPVSGEATVFSFVALPAARQAPGASDRVTVWGELVEQPRLLVVADLAAGEPSDLAIGALLQTTWGEYQGFPVPNFKRVIA
jgi:uncharacterized protein